VRSRIVWREPYDLLEICQRARQVALLILHVGEVREVGSIAAVPREPSNLPYSLLSRVRNTQTWPPP
jgi:hypothetical protein